MITEEHEHRNEDRSENSPLRGTGGYEDVDEGAEKDESYTERNACEASSLESVSTCDRKEIGRASCRERV